MKILMPTMGTRGDIEPYIALANELNNSGYEAVIATHLCWKNLIEQNNIKFYPIGPNINIEYEASVIRGRSNNWFLGAIRTMKFMFKIMENASLEIKQLCLDASLVIASHSHLGAAEAEACGIPYISVTLQPGFLPRKLEKKGPFKAYSEKLISAMISPFMVGSYNKLRKRLGLNRVKTFDALLSPDLNLIPISPLVYPADRFWEEKNKVVGYWFSKDYMDYQPSVQLMDFIKEGPPPIIISLGAMAFESREEREKLDILVNAVNNTEMRAIVQGFNKTLENYVLPDNIISLESVPHGWLFRQAYCVIHHGGFGTTASTLTAGVPSIVIPHMLDQYMWANKIFELGAGPKWISSNKLCVESLTCTINDLKKNYQEISNNVQTLSKQMESENGLAKAVKLISGNPVYGILIPKNMEDGEINAAISRHRDELSDIGGSQS